VAAIRGDMPMQGKLHKSRLYCYDKKKKVVKVYFEQIFSLEECPQSILQSFIDEDYDAEITFYDEVTTSCGVLSQEEIDQLLTVKNTNDKTDKNNKSRKKR
jgi:hypothetical protein